MTSSLRRTPDRAASDELLLRVHSRRPGRAHAVRHPEALHALTPTPAPATVTHTSSPTRDLGTTVLRHLNSPQVLSKDGGKLNVFEDKDFKPIFTWVTEPDTEIVALVGEHIVLRRGASLFYARITDLGVSDERLLATDPAFEDVHWGYIQETSE